MRPVAVVMIDVNAEHLLELSPADDQDPVEVVAADGADPALGERICLGRLERCADDLDAVASGLATVAETRTPTPASSPTIHW